MLEEVLKHAHSNLAEILKLDDPVAKYAIPMPMGVFGTLRRLPRSMGNSHLMDQAPIKLHVKAFLPHFMPHGLSLSYSAGASGAFEVFFYEDKDWRTMLPRVDGLEGFRPGRNSNYYQRTLVNLRVLPESYEAETFRVGIGGFRTGDIGNLNIPAEEWGKYPVVPAWVYSNNNANQQVIQEQSDHPVIWSQDMTHEFASDTPYEDRYNKR